MTAHVHARARELGPLDPAAWLPPPGEAYPPPYRGRGRPPAGGPLLADLRGRYRALVDSFGDAPLRRVHVALARQIRDDFLAAWRTRLGLDPTVPLYVVVPTGARKVGELVAEAQPEALVAVLAGSLVAAYAQHDGQPTADTARPVPAAGGSVPAPPVWDYAATSSHATRSRPEPLAAALLAAAPDGRRQPTKRGEVRSFVADTYHDGAAGLPASFFAGRPGIPSRPAVAQDLLVRADRGYASGTERAAIVVGHTATVDELAAAVAAHFGTGGGRLEWGMADPNRPHAGLASEHTRAPRTLLRLAVGEPAGGGADPRYGPLLAQTGPTPVCTVLGVGWAAWLRVVGPDGGDEWIALRSLAGGPAGRCCPPTVTIAVSTLSYPVSPAA